MQRDEDVSVVQDADTDTDVVPNRGMSHAKEQENQYEFLKRNNKVDIPELKFL